MSTTVIRGEQINQSLVREIQQLRAELDRAYADIRAAHLCIANQESIIQALRANEIERDAVIRSVLSSPVH